ncbi:Chromodomain-helicase-DNA-binding protein 1-like [Boothiomyces sp. JEL0866]|nr:Chromodomain-helicase-DNA-binding protein 1-like [Boothiomyces sp. JEL0866]
MTSSPITLLTNKLKTMQKTNINSTLPLLPHQKKGLDWIHQCWAAGLNGILADEMGLGKTIQAIAFIDSAISQLNPMLIVVPLSLLQNWMDEFRKFAPSISVVAFHGTKEERNDKKLIKPNVVITTYETVLKEMGYFENEAHKLKNSQSLIHKALLSLSIPNKLLLTGTPFQNNLQEMRSLLAFCNPGLFDFDPKEQLGKDYILEEQSGKDYISEEQSGKDYISEEQSGKDYISEFAKLVDPLVLRRTKEKVLDLPDISESIVYTPLTTLQRKVYLSTLSKDYSMFEKKVAGAHNLLIQLQKCSNHPYLFPGIEPEPFTQGEHLVYASGKLLVLDGILTYLKRNQRKALIFSQMTKMLDIVQDFLDIREYVYERLDGSIRGEDRNQSVKNFQQNKAFVFLLSTKAGGVGLNLTAADTVIFLDSDFNPSNDRQAAIESKDLLSLFQYGLNTLVNSSEENKICTDAEIEAIFESEKQVDSEKLVDSMVEDIYVYEGKDYKADKATLDTLISQVGKKREFDETEDDEVRNARAERQRIALERRQNQRKKLVDKWRAAGYISRNVEDISITDSKSYAYEAKVVYVRGDVTRPALIQNENCVIAQVVDNSGKWPYGGVFKAIAGQDKSAEQYYQASKAVNNLTLGSAHVVDFKQKKLALLVAQSETQRSTINQNVFGQSFEKIVDYCKKTNSTLHIPRFGETLEKGNWYGLERIINKYADEKEIQKIEQDKIPKEIAQSIPLLFFKEWIIVFALIFGGCCSNVFALEVLVKEYPKSTQLITLCQFIFVALEASTSQIDFRNFRLKERKIPILNWLVIVILFWSVSVMNNYALGFNISVPLHIIFRFSFPQALGVVIVSVGVVLSTISSSTSKKQEGTMSEFIFGISLLTIALILSCFMGQYQQITYGKYGKHWKEGVFYIHTLSLPFFLLFYRDILFQISEYNNSKLLAVGYLVERALPGPLSKSFIGLVFDVCITGVSKLSSMASSVTVNLVLTVRKCVSLFISIFIFKNAFSEMGILGAFLVFGGTTLYSIASVSKQNKK